MFEVLDIKLTEVQKKCYEAVRGASEARGGTNIRRLCAIAGVPRNACYEYLKGPTAKAVSDSVIVQRIGEIQDNSCYGYGYRLMKTLLKVKFDIGTNENPMLSLMRKNGLLSVVKRKKHSEEVYAKAQGFRNNAPLDLLKRIFHSIVPGNRFVEDITCMPVIEGFLYMNIVLDIFNGEARAWKISEHPNTQLCTDKILMLVEELDGATEEVVVHSKCGIEMHCLRIQDAHSESRDAAEHVVMWRCI